MTQNSTPFTFEGFDNPTTTPVPDIVFDRLLTQLGEAELKALLYIIRRTFGFKRNQDPISFNQFIRGITTRDGRVLDEGAGIRSRSTLSTALKSLEAKGIIRSAKGVDERGENETTVYSLHFKGQASTPDVPPHGVVRNSYHPGAAAAPPVVRNSYPQQTGLQETGRQQTESGEYSQPYPKPEVSLSKFRKGAPKNFDEEKPERRDTISAQRPTMGFAPIGSVLSEQGYPPGRAFRAAGSAEPAGRGTPAPQELEHAQPAQIPEHQRTSTAPPAPAAEQALSRPEQPESGRTPRRATFALAASDKPRYGEDRALISAYLEDFAREFHDQASIKASVTRALRLLAESGYPRERWSEKLYEARGLTRERSAAIGYQGDGQPRAGAAGGGATNKMPYYFELLACVLGRHDHAAGQHPLPLSAAEFRRQRNTGSAGGRQRGKVPSAPQRTLAEQAGEPERKSLAGRFAHLVQH